MPKYVLAPVPFSDTRGASPPPPPPSPPSPLHCKLRADLACLGARNAALYSRCAMRLEEMQRRVVHEDAPSRASALTRSASLPNLSAALGGTFGACSL